MKLAIRTTTFLGVVFVILLTTSWVSPRGAIIDGGNKTFVWNSGTDLNAPERITVEVPLKGKNMETFEVIVTYANGGTGWMAFMNRGGPSILFLGDTGGNIETVSFIVDPAFVNQDGFQNVTVRGAGAEQGLHLYSIKVTRIRDAN